MLLTTDYSQEPRENMKTSIPFVYFSVNLLSYNNLMSNNDSQRVIVVSRLVATDSTRTR